MSEPPVMPERTSDDDDRGWGERLVEDESDVDVRRLLDERPPHHEDRD